MKDGAYLLNASRGSAIDESSLIEAIENGKIAGAWLDSFNDEPYNGPLNKYSQVILTPQLVPIHLNAAFVWRMTRLEIFSGG